MADLSKSSGGAKKNTIWTHNFICIFVIYAMLQLSHSAVNTLASSYAVHLGAGPVLMGMMTGMFFGVALIMRPFIGPITTRFDWRSLMIFATSVGFVVYLGYALFHNVRAFVFFRVASGIQYGIMGTLSMTLAANSVPEEKMASGISMYGIGGALLGVFGPSLGIALRDLGINIKDVDLGYTFVFLLGAAAMFTAIIPSFLLRCDPSKRPNPSETGVWYKNIIDSHVVPSALMIMLYVVGFTIYSCYMVPFAEERGIGSVGSFFVVMGVSIIVIRPISGWLIDHFELRRVLIPVAVVYIISFVVVGTSHTLMGILAGAVLCAIGYGSGLPALQSMGIQSASPMRRSVASNTIYFGLDIGNFISPLIGGIIYGYSNYGVVMLSSIVPVVISLSLFFVFWPGFVTRLKHLASMSEAGKAD